MLKQLENHEQIVRKVTGIGNGAHIFAPKEWLGQEVIIVRPAKSLKEKILSLLGSHLEEIEGLYLYGSHARNEAETGSDIDLLIISGRKIKIKSRGYEIISIKKEDITGSIKIAPILIYSILSDAKPIINAQLLEDLRKKYPPKKSDLKFYIKETKSIMKINKSLISRKENLDGVAYSLILRLKGLYIIKCLLSGKKYSNNAFESWIEENAGGIDYKAIDKAYKSIKRDQKLTIILNPQDLEKLLNLLKDNLKI